MRRRRVLAALATVASAALAGCGSDAPPATSPTATSAAPSSSEGPECAEFPPRIHVQNSLDRRVNVSLVVTDRFDGTTASDRTVTVPPVEDSPYVTRTVTDVAPGNGWYVVNGTAGNRTASYDWRVDGRCGEVLLLRVGDDQFRFDPQPWEG